MKDFPTPTELKAMHELSNAPKIEAFLDECRAKLVESGGATCVVHPSKSLPYTLRDTVRRRLSVKGWDIEFYSDQRDGEWVEIRPKRDTPSSNYWDDR